MRESYERSTEMTARLLPAAFVLSIAGLSLAGSAVAAEVRYDPGDKVYFTYCYAHPPATRIQPGDTVITSTRDASNDAFSVSDKTLAPKIDLAKMNPQTGPFYVEGAEPGDTLVVHIDSIELNRDWGWGGSNTGNCIVTPATTSLKSMFAPYAPGKSELMHSFPAGAVPIVPKNGRIGTSTLPTLLFGMSRVAVLVFLSRCQMNRWSGTAGVTSMVLYSGARAPK